MSLHLLHLNNRLPKIGRWSLLAAVVVIWLFLGTRDDLFKHFIAPFFQKLLTSLSFPHLMYGSPEHANGELTKNGSRLITLVYGLSYCGLSLLIIHLYFMDLNATKIALGLYVCLVLISVLINETGKVYHFEPFRVVAYRIMTMILSPMPIILLIPTLYLTTHTKETSKEALL